MPRGSVSSRDVLNEAGEKSRQGKNTLTSVSNVMVKNKLPQPKPEEGPRDEKAKKTSQTRLAVRKTKPSMHSTTSSSEGGTTRTNSGQDLLSLAHKHNEILKEFNDSSWEFSLVGSDIDDDDESAPSPTNRPTDKVIKSVSVAPSSRRRHRLS
jgi:hypothetical protein